jgi:hypothetical protein
MSKFWCGMPSVVQVVSLARDHSRGDPKDSSFAALSKNNKWGRAGNGGKGHPGEKICLIGSAARGLRSWKPSRYGRLHTPNIVAAVFSWEGKLAMVCYPSHLSGRISAVGKSVVDRSPMFIEC